MSEVLLDLCGGTGGWSRPYADAGYDVRVLTLPEDIRLYRARALPSKVHGVLAAPPCDNLAGSGARWWNKKGEKALLESLSIVDACFRIITLTQPKFWALENPVGRLIHYIGRPKLTFNPCDYGDPYTKKTCLWGNFNIPSKNSVDPIKICKQGSWVQSLGGKSEKTKRLRSITPPGFARAFFEANK